MNCIVLWVVVGASAICFHVSALAASGSAAYLKKPDEWLRSAEGKQVISNVLSWQSREGSWPKNKNTFAKPYTNELSKLNGIFDNGATLDEMRFLARAYNVTKDAGAKTGFDRGLDHILKAQYANGGWPQSYPPGKEKYPRHITFNDETMVRLMRFAREVATSNAYTFVEAPKRSAASEAFDRGVDCVLKCQIKVNGKLTAWCAQHDEQDFSPRGARTYELPSLSGSESVGIVRLLMSIGKPDAEVVRAVDAAMAWFESAKIPGIKITRVEDKSAPKGYDQVVVKDASAKPMWARFYEIDTNKPFFCGRDGVKKESLAEIEYERRNGYAWLGYWPETLLTKEYPAWKQRIARP